MILVPQRLFTAPSVRTIAKEGNNCLLHKQLSDAQVNQEAYVANHVVSLVLSGRQLIRTYDEDVISASAGEVLFLPRGVYYITDLLPSKGTFSSLLFYFDDDIIHRFLCDTDVMEVDRNAAPDHLHFPESTVLQAFSSHVLQMSQAQIFTQPLLQLKALELLHLLHGLTGSQAFARFLFRLTLPKQRSLRKFMESNYDKPLGVEDYAYLTGRSISSFRRDFRDYFSTTPNKWLRNQRLQQAIATLNAREMSVTELSYSVGYENISYFIREFRKVTGLSPKQYMLARRASNKPPADA
jgi:AraC-like DNA-binding protein